jgi:hypothetical protein
VLKTGKLRQEPFVVLGRLSLLVAIVALCGGCSTRQSADESLNKALANAGQIRQKVYPLAGRITIDGAPPHIEKPANKIVVMLNDPLKPDAPIGERPFAVVDSHGAFAFETYFNGDGVEPGKYVVTFAMLRKKGRKGFVGPDQLNNLYNDPEQNSKDPDFVIVHQAPGKTSYAFNLEVAGKEPATAQPHALTEILWGR